MSTGHCLELVLLKMWNLGKIIYRKDGNRDMLERIVAYGLIMFLSIAIVMVTQIYVPVALAEDNPVEWDVTLNFNESGGRHDYVTFGEASDAADGQDDYDLIEPPFPPQLPYLVAWFDTNLDEPYNKLWCDYRPYPDDHNVWNLSVMWVTEPGNESSANIDISWDPSKIVESGYESVLLYGDDDTVAADMIIENHYNFDSSSGSLHRFQIICQSGTVDNNETPFLHIFLILVTILVVAYWKKNN